MVTAASRSTNLPLRVQSNQDWLTPGWLFYELCERWSFTLDAAASRSNALCTTFYDGGKAGDGLLESWHKYTFCNPPYRNIRPWVDKALVEAIDRQCTSVLLLPARLESKWFVDYYAFAKTEIIAPRLAFEGGKGNSPPHGSMLMIFSPDISGECSSIPPIRVVHYRKPKGGITCL